jgi:hypothetical protein
MRFEQEAFRLQPVMVFVVPVGVQVVCLRLPAFEQRHFSASLACGRS